MASHLFSTHSTSQEVLQHWQSLVEQGVDLKHNKPLLEKLISKSSLNQQTMHQLFTNLSIPALAKTRLYTQQTFHKYICNLVCENNISVNTICSPGMKEFIGWLNVVALCYMPNTKKVRRLVEEQYETMREQTDKLIRESATKISRTIDG
jgi:GTP cyclohydrolase I